MPQIFLFYRSSAVDFIDTFARGSDYIKSHDAIFYFSKSLLLLLQDEVQEIRDRSSKIAMRVVRGDSDVISSYAQEKFIESFMNLFANFDDSDASVLAILIIANSVDENSEPELYIEKNRAFDKSEANEFSEHQVTQKQLKSLLLSKFSNLSRTEYEEMCLKFIESNRKFEKSGNETEVAKFLKSVRPL